MRHFYNKILSISLSFFVLFSTASFSVDLHYCCGKLIDIGVFEKAETCSAKLQKSDFDSCVVSDESCCHNNELNKIGQDDLKKPLNGYFNYVTNNFVDTNISYFDLFLELKENTISFYEYSPPLLFRDIIILHETFLI